MTDGTSPFIYRPVHCPICGEEHQQPHFRLRLYLESERESDGHVLHYKWLNERARPVHPPHYYLYHCPHCYFTDVTTDYRDRGESEFSPLVERTVRRLPDKEKALLAFLAQRVDYSNIDSDSALALHYIAAYIQLLLPEDTRDNLKIGRLALRIAWLFREQGPAEGGEIKDPVRRDALEAVTEFEGRLHQVMQGWQRTNQALLSQLEGGKNLIRKHRDNVEKLLETLSTELYRLKVLCKDGVSPASTGNGTEALQEFLARLKGMWSTVPTDEVEAMRMAVRYLDKAISRDPIFDDAQTYLNAISLIIDVMIRCGDFDAAFDMVRAIYRNATQARAALQERLRNPDLDETAKQRVRNRMRGLSRSLEHAAELRRKLIGKLIERDRDSIRKIIAAHAGAPVQNVVAALEKSGISPGVVGYLKEQGELDPKKTKKLKGR